MDRPALLISRTLLSVYFVHFGSEKLHETAARLHCSTLDIVDEDLDALRGRFPTAVVAL